MREAAQHSEQDLLRLEQRPPRGHPRERARAEQDRERDTLVLEGRDARLHPRQHVGLADEDRRGVREPRDEDLVVARGRQARDGRAVQAVERPRLEDLDAR